MILNALPHQDRLSQNNQKMTDNQSQRPQASSGLREENKGARLRASAPSAMASSMDITRTSASALLESGLSPEEKAFVVSKMGAMNSPTGGAYASTLPNSSQHQQLTELSALMAHQQSLEQAKHAIELDALRTRLAAEAAVSASLYGNVGGFRGLQGLSGGANSNRAFLAGLMAGSSTSPLSLLPAGLTGSSLAYAGRTTFFPRANAIEDLLRPPAAHEPQQRSLPLQTESKKKGGFPTKLHKMLSDLEASGASDIASFLPHGRAFAIHKPREFVKHVMPRYFRMSRFSSFQRQLNLYEFHRITEGVDRGAYYNSQFLYGQPQEAAAMKRVKIKGVKKAKEAAQERSNTEEVDSVTEDVTEDSSSK